MTGYAMMAKPPHPIPLPLGEREPRGGRRWALRLARGGPPPPCGEGVGEGGLPDGGEARS